MATETCTTEDAFMANVQRDTHFIAVMDFLKEEDNGGLRLKPEILMEVFHKYHQYIVEGDRFAPVPVPTEIEKKFGIHSFRKKGSPNFLETYGKEWDSLQHQVFEQRMKPLLYAYVYEENNDPPKIDFDVHDHLLRAMIDIRTKRADRYTTLVRGKYEHPEGWSIGFDIEYWNIPMEGWFGMFPNLTITVHYTNEYGEGFMNQFYKCNAHLGEVLGLISKSNTPLEWKY